MTLKHHCLKKGCDVIGELLSNKFETTAPCIASLGKKMTLRLVHKK